MNILTIIYSEYLRFILHARMFRIFYEYANNNLLGIFTYRTSWWNICVRTLQEQIYYIKFILANNLFQMFVGYRSNIKRRNDSFRQITVEKRWARSKTQGR